MKLKENEFYALKLVDQDNSFYGDGAYTLRGAKLYKTINRAIEAQNGFSYKTEIVIITLNVRKLENN